MSTDPVMTAILEELAAGRIDAAEAARRIDQMSPTPAPAPTPVPPATPVRTETPAPSAATPEAGPPDSIPPGDGAAGEDPWAVATDRPQHPTHTTERFAPAGPAVSGPVSGDDRPEPPPVNVGGVEKISVRVVGRRVRIVGEASVATLSADGTHLLRRNGSVLEVTSEGELGASLDGFSILRGAPRNLEDIRALGLGKELFLRINPRLVVDVELTAGSLSVEQVPHLGRVRVTAGSAKLLDVNEINDALVQAGSATIKGSITRGRNRIRAESGSLTIVLDDDSNVTVTGETQLGKISWAGGHSGAGDEVVMGNGSARLDVGVVMGHAQIRVGSEHLSDADAS